MSSDPAAIVANPSSIVTEHVVAFGAVGGPPTAVDGTHPLPVADRAFTGARTMTPDVEQAPARAVLIDCSAAGRIALRLADDSSLSLPVGTGLTILPFAAKAVLAAGTTATASFASLA